MAKKLIALDDGHGMATAGKRTPTLPSGQKSSETGKNFMHENEFNRAVVKYLDKHLKRCGFDTLLVAPTDDDTPLEKRTALANNKKADLYLSIHANANAGKWFDGGGIETYIHPSGESKRIGNILHKHVMKGTEFRNRGVKDGSHLWVIRKTNMPAVLFELSFMDSKHDYKYLLQDSYRRECAEEIARGVCEAYNVKYVEEKSEAGKVTPAKPVVKGDTVKNEDKDVLFRVRKSKDDAKTQKGAFHNIESAKDEADKNAGYEVYDIHGNLVYTPKKAETKKAEPKKTEPAKSTPKPADDNKANPSYPGKLIKNGSKGKDVERIQRAVGVTADGIFGANTEKAVKAYQKRKGLAADGIVGKNTWNMMF